jgi:hypothetical protein
MLLTERQPIANPRLRDAPAEVQLRLRADGQLVAVPPGKTTIGSSPRCNVRIQEPGVQPLHCLIVNEAGQLTLRRWAENALLNGRMFNDAPLVPGDCLSLGGVELQCEAVEDRPVLAAEHPSRLERDSQGTVDWQPPVESTLQQPSDPPAAPEESGAYEWETSADRSLEEPISPSYAAAEEVFRRLQEAVVVARGRNRKLLAALRQMRDEANVTRLQLAEAEYASAVFDDERAQWQQLRDELEAKLAAAEPNWQPLIGETASQSNDHLHSGVLRRQIGEWEARLAENVRRLDELQKELASVDSEGEAYDASVGNHEPGGTAESAEAPPTSALWRQVPEPSTLQDAPEQADCFSDSNPFAARIETENELTAGADWSAADGGFDTPSEEFISPAPESCGFDAVPEPADSTRWGSDSSTSSSPVAESEHESPRSTATHWDTADKSGNAWDNPATEPTHPSTVADSSTGIEPGRDSGAFGEPQENGPNPFGAVFTSPAAVAESARDDREDSIAQGAPPVAPPPPQPASFIERYAHMFPDDNAEAAPPAVAPQRAQTENSLITKPRTMGIVRSEGSGGSLQNEPEESIEQYMAKLLQRVRGDAPAPAAPVTELPQVVELEPVAAQPVVLAPIEAANDAAELPAPVEPAAIQAAAVEAAKRRAPAALPATNLDALRALANESARRAIGTHGLRKNRRDATTKFIVAMLAGMTSLLLMLESLDWRDMQFITACVSLVAACYWAGQAYRKLCDAFEAAAYDGPATDTTKPVETVESALPIDV